jgi:polyisoprenoid-binding protein YceI
MQIKWLFCVAVLASQSALAAETFTIDPAHSTIGFKVRHFFSRVTGRFSEVKGAITFDEKNPESSSVQVAIGPASINTDNKQRDDDLRSANFFDVDKFSSMSFKSTSVKSTGEKTADVIGDLTMHGVTRPVTLKVEFLDKGKGMKGATLAGWDATTRLRRSEFGLTWNKAVEGTQVVGDDVDVQLHIEADAKS